MQYLIIISKHSALFIPARAFIWQIPIDIEMEGLKRFLLSKGAILNRVTTGTASQSKGYGLYFAGDFSNGDTVLEIGREIWLPYSAAAARKEFGSSLKFTTMLDKVGCGLGIQPEQKTTFEESVCLATKILSAKDERISPYITFLEENSWPFDQAKPIHPLMLPFESLELISECAAYRGLVSRKRFHSVVGEFLFTAPNVNAYLWAMSIILSRGISGRGYPFTLVPYIDLANHSMNPNSAVHYDDANGIFYLKTIKDVKKGEEATISYGDSRNNSSVVGLYGFYEPDNVSDDLVFSFSISPDSSKDSSDYAIIPKVALNYYTAYRVEPRFQELPENEYRDQRVNICRVVLKDGLDKVFAALSDQSEDGYFINGIPSQKAEIKAADLMTSAAHQKLQRLKMKLKEAKKFSMTTTIIGADGSPVLGNDTDLRCPHWNETSIQYLNGEIKASTDLIRLLEEFREIVAVAACATRNE